MGPIGCRETSARNYHYWLRNNAEEPSSHLLRSGSLTSRTSWVSLMMEAASYSEKLAPCTNVHGVIYELRTLQCCYLIHTLHYITLHYIT